MDDSKFPNCESCCVDSIDKTLFAIRPHMVALAEITPAICLCGRLGWIFKYFILIQQDRHHQYPPTTWLKNAKQLMHGFAIIWNMLQHMRTDEGIHRFGRINCHVGKVNLVINILLAEVCRAIGNVKGMLNPSPERLTWSEIHHFEIKWRTSQSLPEIKGIKAATVRRTAMRAHVLCHVTGFRLKCLKCSTTPPVRLQVFAIIGWQRLESA